MSRVFTVLIIACCAAMTASRAEAQSTAHFGLDAGATVPVSAYATDKHTGYHLGLLVDFRAPAPVLGFRVEGAYHELKYAGNSTRAQIWMADANLLLKIPTATPVRPYLIGGAGIYSSHRSLFLNTGYSTKPGLNAGAGLHFDLGEGGVFIESRYHRASGDDAVRFVPITIGVLF